MRHHSDHHDIATFLKTANCKVGAQLELGVFHYDCANWVAYVSDLAHVMDVHGVRCQRKASLASGVYEYYDQAGNLIHTNA